MTQRAVKCVRAIHEHFFPHGGLNGRTKFNWPHDLLNRAFLLDVKGRADRMRFGYHVLTQWDKAYPDDCSAGYLALNRNDTGPVVVYPINIKAGKWSAVFAVYHLTPLCPLSAPS